MGDDGYGSLSSYSSKLYGGSVFYGQEFLNMLFLYCYLDPRGLFNMCCNRLPPPSTLEMIVPAHAVGKVMGKGGANIANIRKVCPFLS